MEPVLIGRTLAMRLKILEGPKITADVVETASSTSAAPPVHSSENRAMSHYHQSAVNLVIVDCVITMTGGLENRPQIKGIHTQLLHVIQPGVKRFNSLRRLEIDSSEVRCKGRGDKYDRRWRLATIMCFGSN